MRLRNIPGSEEKILAHPYAFQTDGAVPGEYKGLWNRNVFKTTKELYVEIGMGKGQFITQMAMLHPEINYIGIEKYSSVLVRALDKFDREPLENLRFLRMDAEDILEFFDQGEISGIYLNFSDPWPKDRHAKRRLTSLPFLKRYERVLEHGGELQFKTDNRPLFDFSLKELDKAGWKLLDFTYDLHKDGPAPGNVMTEYEEKFFKLGNPICRFRAVSL